jgi:hypothetical protein
VRIMHGSQASPPTGQGLGPTFHEQARRFAAFGAPSVEAEDAGIPYVINAFWTAAQRQASPLHEVSYRACFKPQLPAFFITRLTAPGDRVHDPFMGRGTTPLEAALLGRTPVGSDVNPLSVLLTRPRLRAPSLPEIARALGEIPWAEGRIGRDDLLAFYSPGTLRQIGALREYLREHAPLDGAPDPALDWIRMVALNRLTGHSPGFFSVYTLPPNQAVSVAAQRRINAQRRQTPPERDVPAIILKKSRQLLADGSPCAPGALLRTAPAHGTPDIATGSVALVVTSPPFLDVVQYAEDNWLRCWFAGINGEGIAISQHRTEAAWQRMVRAVLVELARVLRPGGHLAFEVGEVRGGRVLLERLVWDAAEGLPFDRLFVMVNRQAFTKTARCWGVSNNARGTNTNRIVLLRRSA